LSESGKPGRDGQSTDVRERRVFSTRTEGTTFRPAIKKKEDSGEILRTSHAGIVNFEVRQMKGNGMGRKTVLLPTRGRVLGRKGPPRKTAKARSEWDFDN